MTDYTKLDAAILALINCRPVTFTDICSNRNVQAQVQPHAAADPKKPTFRFVDARLQALRKRGLIKYAGKTGWRKAAPKDTEKPEAAL